MMMMVRLFRFRDTELHPNFFAKDRGQERM